ncbi:MAG: insulinase family protein [Oleiphilaceae bacterium]|nr:insulinase family protein [Oleiphilaceae bacterium]
MSASLKPETVHPAFRWIRSHAVETLHLTVEEYEHKATGARHLHLAADNDENVFLVAFRTCPMDSTGVAHILEHTVLCGSENYPVRDPFFMMIQRSLNTFMNAFTSSDWTAYPFASKNRKDFDNLLSVYLDSVFFSRLEELDFAQEGHRLEFATPDDPATPLTHKGVVYNEMKGAMSSPVSQLWQTLSRHLFPTTTYHHNSGGEPDHIVDLSYQQLLDFYQHHYHPSNALFATFGTISAYEHHEKFEQLALKRFEKKDIRLPVHDEKRYYAPVRVQEHYALDEGEKTRGKTHVVVAWLLGHSFDLESNLEAELLTSVLLENSASPLQRALETSDIGHAPSPLCGLEDSNREMTFVCGIEGTEPDQAGAVEALLESTLEKVAAEGVSQGHLEAILHQLELEQREISGDGFPYGLQLVMQSLAPMVHGGDPVALLDLEPVLERLRERIKDPDYVPGLVRRLLLDNPHRVTLTLSPDTALEGRRQAAMEAALARRKEQLSESQAQSLVDQARELQLRQNHKDDDSLLPRVGIEDVPGQVPEPKGEKVKDFPATCYLQGTNGLVYQQLLTPLPALYEQERQLLPLYSMLITELGAGDLDYLAMQERITAESGGLGAHFTVKGAVDDVQSVRGYFSLGGKALSRNAGALAALIQDVYNRVRFDEHERIRDLVAQARARREQSVVGSGHALAMGAASQGSSPVAQMNFRIGGLAGIRELCALDDALEDPAELSALAQRLQALHGKLTRGEWEFLLIGEQDGVDQSLAAIRKLWERPQPSGDAPFSLEPVSRQVQQAWLTNTQVNFCARAYPTVPVEHPDAAPLSVLGGFLRNGYLHRTLREQGGAYGGGASQDSGSGVFRFFSYRDPRLEETLADFDASLQWLMEEEHEAHSLEEAILGVISQLDKPHSPAGEARHAFTSRLFGRDAAQRQRFRERVLNVTLEDLRRVTGEWLRPERASTAVVSSHGNEKSLSGLGFELQSL